MRGPDEPQPVVKDKTVAKTTRWMYWMNFVFMSFLSVGLLPINHRKETGNISLVRSFGPVGAEAEAES